MRRMTLTIGVLCVLTLGVQRSTSGTSIEVSR